MKVYGETLILTSNGKRPTYHEITDQVREILKKSGVQNGICVVASPHTTCSVIFEEFSHDRNFYEDEFLLVDLNHVLDQIIPICTTENQYYHPGPEHAKFAEVEKNAHRMYTLNTDAHLRSSLIGTSQTFMVTEGVLQTGEVGYIYFVDWDHQRVRDRNCLIKVLGV